MIEGSTVDPSISISGVYHSIRTLSQTEEHSPLTTGNQSSVGKGSGGRRVEPWTSVHSFRSNGAGGFLWTARREEWERCEVVPAKYTIMTLVLPKFRHLTKRKVTQKLTSDIFVHFVFNQTLLYIETWFVVFFKLNLHQ